jgi:hypothetical protein
MDNFLIGALAGLAVMRTLTFIVPGHITGVNVELVKVGLAHYDSKASDCVRNDGVTK